MCTYMYIRINTLILIDVYILCIFTNTYKCIPNAHSRCTKRALKRGPAECTRCFSSPPDCAV